MEGLVLNLSEGVEALLKEALWEGCVDCRLRKVIFVSNCILFNHHDSPIFNNMLVKYLNIVHVHLAQYNIQQVRT